MNYIQNVFLFWIAAASVIIKSRSNCLLSVNNLHYTNSLVVIDTDAGTDDAMAIFMMLGAEKLFNNAGSSMGPRILAVTAVNGNTGVDNVTLNVLKVLNIANRLDILVYRGSSGSIMETPKTDGAFGADGMGDVPFADPPSLDLVEDEWAVNALVRLVGENPGKITVLALGPLTNIALAARLDDTFLSNLKHLVIMGGSIRGVGNTKPGVEFNFRGDPTANYVLFEGADVGNTSISIMPWETVIAAGITTQWRTTVLGNVNSASISFLNKAEAGGNVYSKSHWLYADVMAAAAVLQPDLFKSQLKHHIVPVTDGVTRGAISVDYANDMANLTQVTLLEDLDAVNFQNLVVNMLSQV